MTRLALALTAAILLLAPAAQAGWAHSHLSRAWGGGLSSLEVGQLEAEIDEANPKTGDGYWSLLLLAIHRDAAGDVDGTCALVARFDDVPRARKDLRLKTLRAGCLLAAGDLDAAARLARAGAQAAAASEPVDFVGVLLRAHAIHANARLRLWKAKGDDESLRVRAEKAIASWEEAARQHRKSADLIEAMAWKAEVSR